MAQTERMEMSRPEVPPEYTEVSNGDVRVSTKDGYVVMAVGDIEKPSIIAYLTRRRAITIASLIIEQASKL